MLAKWLNDPHGKPPYDPATGTLSWTTFRQNLFGYAYYQHGAVSCRGGKRCHSLHTAACTRQPPHGSRHTAAATPTRPFCILRHGQVVTPPKAAAASQRTNTAKGGLRAQPAPRTTFAAQVIWGWSLSIMCYCLMFVLPFVAIAAVRPMRRRFYRAFYLLHLVRVRVT